MKQAVVSVLLSLLGGTVGLFFGAALNDAIGGAVLLTLAMGIGCIVYAIKTK